MGLRLGALDDDARYDAWIRIVRRIYDEQVAQAWGYYMFRLLRAVFVTNQHLSEHGGFIFRWMVENYVDSALMLLRRELDRQDGTENLLNLLLDMIERPVVVNRGRYLTRWGPDQPVHRWHANRAFDGFGLILIAGQPEADHIDPTVIRADLDRINTGAEHLREYAERTRAHRSPDPGLDTARMTFGALHEALGSIRDVIAKYYALLTQASIGQWEAVPQFSTIQPFARPWVEDRAAVERAVQEESR
jgi:hypothetical protein